MGGMLGAGDSTCEIVRSTLSDLMTVCSWPYSSWGVLVRVAEPQCPCATSRPIARTTGHGDSNSSADNKDEDASSLLPPSLVQWVWVIAPSNLHAAHKIPTDTVGGGVWETTVILIAGACRSCVLSEPHA